MINFLLFIVAYILYLPLALINFCLVWSKGYFRDSALTFDRLANREFRTLWNAILRKRNGYQFGVKGETISSALGKNQRDKTLSVIGWILVYILWGLDFKYWKKGGHCINSIIED